LCWGDKREKEDKEVTLQCDTRSTRERGLFGEEVKGRNVG